MQVAQLAAGGPGHADVAGGIGSIRKSGHPLVGRQGEELGVVVGQRDLREQGHGLVVPRCVERGARALRIVAVLLDDRSVSPWSRRAVIQGDVGVQPLPDLGTGDLGRGRVLPSG